MRRLCIFMICFIILVGILLFMGCGSLPSNPGEGWSSRPIAAVVQHDISLVNVKHILGGESTEFSIEGNTLDDFRAWVKDLHYIHKTFAEGNSPGDVDGGEVYIFEMTEGDYPGFSYIINGNEDCYLLIEGEWYSVSNPSNPPIVK